MEFFLVKDVEVTLMNIHYNYLSSSESVYVSLNPCGVMDRKIRDVYNAKLCVLLGLDTAELTAPERTTEFKLRGDIYQDKSGVGKFDLFCFTSHQRCIFQRLYSAFTPRVPGQPAAAACNAYIRIKVRKPGTKSGWALETNDFQINENKGMLSRYGTCHTIEAMPEEIYRHWTTGDKKFTGVFSIILVLNDNAVNSFLVPKPSPANAALEEMLKNEIEADTEVVPGGDGAVPVKCHRSYLASRSPVFKAMFQSGMKEAATNRIQMPDMTESEVRAFVDYLYTWDVKALLADCHLAMAMMKAGHCYNVPDLCTAVYNIIMMKTYDWFSVDVAADLFLFTKDLCHVVDCLDGSYTVSESEEETLYLLQLDEAHFLDLKRKATHVLKWYSNERGLDKRQSKNFTNFFEQNPQIAKELFVSFLKCIDPNEVY